MVEAEDLALPRLELSEGEAEHLFTGLQGKLLSMWGSIRTMNDAERTIVVVPSQTIDFDPQGAEMQAYEERFLFLLLLLRQPHVRIVYITSQTVLPSTIDYYLNLLPDADPEEARRRLFLVAPEDRSNRPLVRKILERPRLIAQIRALIPDRNNAHLVPYVTTTLERDLALLLGIPVYGTDPRFVPYGTKSGCRRLFAEEGIQHPAGVENLESLSHALEATMAIRRANPNIDSLMLKLNEGISGEGNAVIDLRDLPPPTAPGEREALQARFREMALECPSETYEGFLAKLAARGGVVEERLIGEELRSPSVQLRISPHGEIELLSTHDQVLGGPNGQLYLGCCFPADQDYASQITAAAARIGRRLAAEGVIGRLAVDFLVMRNRGGAWDAHAIEINLRKGGTTHPYLTLEFLTDGAYDPERAVFETPSGQSKHYVASDHLESALYRALCPRQLEQIAAARGLHYCPRKQTGVVFHMFATLAENGRIGVTAIGNSADEARALFDATAEMLQTEAERALQPVEITSPAA